MTPAFPAWVPQACTAACRSLSKSTHPTHLQQSVGSTAQCSWPCRSRWSCFWSLSVSSWERTLAVPGMECHSAVVGSACMASASAWQGHGSSFMLTGNSWMRASCIWPRHACKLSHLLGLPRGKDHGACAYQIMRRCREEE